MVQEVVCFKSQFHFQAFGDGGVLKDGKVELTEIWSDQRISSQVSKVPRARRTTSRGAVERSVRSAGHHKCAQIKKVLWIALMINDRSDNVGLREELPATVKIVLRENQMERLAGLHGDDSVDSPPIREPAPAALAVREVVDETPSQPVPHVEIGISAIQFRLCAVGWLVRILHEVVAVTGI